MLIHSYRGDPFKSGGRLHHALNLVRLELELVLRCARIRHVHELHQLRCILAAQPFHLQILVQQLLVLLPQFVEHLNVHLDPVLDVAARQALAFAIVGTDDAHLIRVFRPQASSKDAHVRPPV